MGETEPLEITVDLQTPGENRTYGALLALGLLAAAWLFDTPAVVRWAAPLGVVALPLLAWRFGPVRRLTFDGRLLRETTRRSSAAIDLTQHVDVRYVAGFNGPAEVVISCHGESLAVPVVPSTDDLRAAIGATFTRDGVKRVLGDRRAERALRSHPPGWGPT